MNNLTTTADRAQLVDRATQLRRPGRPALLGITGGPQAHNVAKGLTQALGGLAILVPPSGFRLPGHGSNSIHHDPDSLDAWGFLALFERLHHRHAETIYAPGPHSRTGEPVPAAIAIPMNTQLVITSCSHLMTQQHPWSLLANLLDELWHIETTEQLASEPFASPDNLADLTVALAS
jgi:hypothetical protein